MTENDQTSYPSVHPAIENGPAGGDPSNTPPANHSLTAEPPTLTDGGIDTLELACRVAIDPYHAEDLFEAMDRSKIAAKNADPDPRETTVWIADHCYQVGPAGSSGGAYYTWVLHGQGTRLALQRTIEPAEQQYNVKLRVGSMACLLTGSVPGLTRHAMLRLQALGTVLTCKVSRADFFVDLAELQTAQLQVPFTHDEWISRGRNTAEFATYRDGRKMTGFSIGKEILLRVYDKLAELERDPIKLAAWLEFAWGNQRPDHVTRIEFQLRREALKTLGVDGLDSLAPLAPSIAAYLCKRWFRLTDGPVDRRNPQRCPTLPAWKRVQETFAHHLGRADAGERLFDRKTASPLQLWRMVRGCIESAAAMGDVHVDGIEDMAAWAREELIHQTRREKSPREIPRKILEKKRKLEAENPLTPPPQEPTP